MKTLTNHENPSRNPLQTACCGIPEPWFCKLFRKPEMILKHVMVLIFITGRWLTIGISQGWIEAHNFLWVAFPLSCRRLVEGWVGEGGGSDAASVKIFIISKCFHRSKQELKKYFSRHWRCKKNLKTFGANTESPDLIFKAFKKIIPRDTVPLTSLPEWRGWSWTWRQRQRFPRRARICGRGAFAPPLLDPPNQRIQINQLELSTKSQLNQSIRPINRNPN